MGKKKTKTSQRMHNTSIKYCSLVDAPCILWKDCTRVVHGLNLPGLWVQRFCTLALCTLRSQLVRTTVTLTYTKSRVAYWVNEVLWIYQRLNAVVFVKRIKECQSLNVTMRKTRIRCWENNMSMVTKCLFNKEGRGYICYTSSHAGEMQCRETR